MCPPCSLTQFSRGPHIYLSPQKPCQTGERLSGSRCTRIKSCVANNLWGAHFLREAMPWLQSSSSLASLRVSSKIVSGGSSCSLTGPRHLQARFARRPQPRFWLNNVRRTTLPVFKSIWDAHIGRNASLHPKHGGNERQRRGALEKIDTHTHTNIYCPRSR